jgi:pimeloyl-ACP methyl ester carboxylesterase
LIHGYPDSSRSWSLTAPRLVGDFRLIVADVRGQGASEAPECCYTLPDLAYDMRLLLDELGIERASVVGHSLGSMVGQVFAQRYPERVNKLVLVASAASARGVAAPGGWMWDNIHQLRAPIDPDSQFVRNWQSNPTPVDEAFMTRARAESAAVPLHVWMGVLYELATSDYGRLSSQIQAPTLIVWGTKDVLFDAAEQEALRKAMPNATFKTFDGLGHNLAWEEPEAVGDAIAAFLR